LTFALSWGVVVVYILARRLDPGLAPVDGHSLIFALTNGAPSLAAIAVVGFRSGFAGVRSLTASLFKRFHWIWLVVSILLFPACVWALSGGAAVWHRPWPVTPDQAFCAMPMALLTTPVLFTRIAPIGEEQCHGG
jgi:hypothetical protein